MRRTARNAASLFAGEVATRLLGFLVSALLARRLGIDGFGQIGFAFSVMSYGFIVTKFGLLTVGIREAGRNRGAIPTLVSNMLAFRLVLGLAAATGMVVFALLSRPETRWLLVLFSAGVVLQSLLLEWLFTAIERMEFVGLSHSLINALYLVLVLVLVRGKQQVLAVPVAYAAATLVAALVLLVVYAASYGLPTLVFDRVVWKKLALQSWPVGLASVLTQLYVNSGIIGLSLLRSNYEAGLYTASHRLVFFLLMLDRILQTLFLPLVSRYFASARDRLPELVGSAFRVVISLSLPLSVGLSLLARPLLTLVFGEQFVPAASSLSILVWFLPLSLLTTLTGYILVAVGQEKRFLVNTALGVILAMAVLVPGIVLWGLSAAAGAMVLGEAMILVLMGRDALKVCRPAVEQRIVSPFLGSAAFAAIILLVSRWSWVVAAGAAAVVYLAILLAGKGLTINDLRLAKG